LSVSPTEVAGGVDAEEDEEQECEAPKRRAAVAEEREGNTDDGRQAQDHAHVDEDMEQENT